MHYFDKINIFFGFYQIKYAPNGRLRVNNTKKQYNVDTLSGIFCTFVT